MFSSSRSFPLVHLRESLPTSISDLDVHGPEGRESLRPARHVLLPQVCAEETQLCKLYAITYKTLH